ncbi:hypothetical protein CN374_00065 [Bacillus cereus]|nr:hypothetical protein CN374_00065 [Bacillus cereus]
MEQIINYFSSINWATFSSSLIATSGLVYFIFKTWAKEKLSHEYKKKFEEYKRKLDEHAEYQKLDFQRKIHDFGLYSSKRHEIYPTLYKQILIAQSYVLRLRGLKVVPTFEEYNEEDIRNYLESKKILKGKVNEIVGMWQEDKARAIKEVNSYMKIVEMQEAQNELSKARNQLWGDELYLSPEVSKLAQSLTRDISKLLINIEFYEPSVREENRKLEKELEEGIIALKDEMQDELSIGNYVSEMD